MRGTSKLLVLPKEKSTHCSEIAGFVKNKKSLQIEDNFNSEIILKKIRVSIRAM